MIKKCCYQIVKLDDYKYEVVEVDLNYSSPKMVEEKNKERNFIFANIYSKYDDMPS